ncbi:hypothetical protein BBJ28_00024185 [Nothophytophthora sp. Chile5]|nr:hypothetical protein BBJ28_00024185 [Nothophytophthora sp. Chile5]
MAASQNDHTDVVELLLANKASVDIQRPNGASALFIACQNGQVGAARALLVSGAAIELADDEGFTALMAASQKGHTDVVDLLLANKASVDTQRPNGDTALGLACYFGQVGTVQALLASGAAIELANDQGFTALMAASQKGHTDVVELLLANKANVDAQLPDGATALYIACLYGHRYGDILNPGELDMMSVVFDAIVRYADVVVAAVPQWFAISETEWSRAEASPVDEGEEVCVRDASFFELLNHPNVRKFYGACHVAKPFVIHEESYALDSRGATWGYLLGCAHGLAYVHEQGLVHRGLSVNHLLRSYTSKKGLLSGMGLVRRQDAGHDLTEADAERERKSQSPEISGHINDPSVSSDILAFGLAIFDLLAINHEIGVAASPDESYKEKRERVDIARERVRQQPTKQLPATQTDYVKEAEWNLLLGMCAADPAARTSMEDVVYQVGVLAQQEKIGHSLITETQDTSSATVEDVRLYQIQSLGMTLRETLDEADELCSEVETFHDVNRAVCARLVDVYEQLERTRTPLSTSLVESFSLILLRFYDMLEKSTSGGYSIVASTCAAQTVSGKNYSMHHDIDRLIYNSSVLESTSGVHRWRPTWDQARQRQHETMQKILENPSSALRQLESDTKRSEAVALLQFSARESGGISSLGSTTPLAQLGGISAETLPQWFIPAHQVELRDHIADGSFGAVYRGEWLGTDVVVKQVLTDQENKENRAQFRQEIDLWFSLNHEHLIKLYGACHEGRPFFCLMGARPTFASDIYSFGMCIIEVLTGKFPWGNSIPDEAVRHKVTKEKLIPARPEEFSDPEWDLVTRMCSFDPELRINAGAVVNWADYFAKND